MDWKFVLVLIFSLFVAVFTMQNADAVNIQFLTFEFTQVSQALVILISAVAGALIALLFGAIRWVRDKSKIMTAKKSIAGLETQVKQLKLMLEAQTAKAASQAAPSEDTQPAPVETSGELQEPDEEPEAESEEVKPEESALKKKWYQL